MTIQIDRLILLKNHWMYVCKKTGTLNLTLRKYLEHLISLAHLVWRWVCVFDLLNDNKGPFITSHWLSPADYKGSRLQTCHSKPYCFYNLSCVNHLLYHNNIQLCQAFLSNTGLVCHKGTPYTLPIDATFSFIISKGVVRTWSCFEICKVWQMLLKGFGGPTLTANEGGRFVQ